MWPASLERLSFGENFNQPIDGVAWPVSLRQLSFGESFNRPIDAVVCPASWQQLSFGENFNRPIETFSRICFSIISYLTVDNTYRYISNEPY